MATVTCKTADGVERTVTVESENTCPLYSYGEEHRNTLEHLKKHPLQRILHTIMHPQTLLQLLHLKQCLEKLESLMKVLKLGVKLMT